MSDAWGKTLARVGYALSDSVLGVCGKLGWRVGSGRRHARYSPEKSADYIEWYVNLFEDLLGAGAYAGDVCELGPGDSLGAGVLYRARGATSVTFVERFQRPGDTEAERAVCEVLAQRERAKGRAASAECDWTVFMGEGAEARWRAASARHDLIVTNSVFQHARDPMPLMQACYDRLKPGGRMLHVIDLRNLGLLKRWGELAWLETAPWLHHLMVRHTGRPNRVRFDAYREWAEGVDGEFFVRIRHLAGVPEALGDRLAEDIDPGLWRASRSVVEAARPGFTPSLRGVSTDDQAVATFLLQVRKPNDP